MTIENQYEHEQRIVRKPIWNPKYFFILTILFSHIPISIFYIINFIRLKKKLWNESILIIIIATLLMLIGIFNIPNEFMVRIISLAITYGLGYYMKITQETMYKEHIDNGGKSANYILPIIVSLVFISVIIWLQVISVNIPDKYIEFLDDEIYYTDHVKVEDVNRLGEFLIETEYFIEDNLRTSVKLDYTDNVYRVFFVINKEYIDDEYLINAFRYLRNELKEKIYSGSAVEIIITDELFNILKTIND